MKEDITTNESSKITNEELTEEIEEIKELVVEIKDKLELINKNPKLKEELKKNIININTNTEGKESDKNIIKKSIIQRFKDSIEKEIKTDTSRITGLTDGIFGMVLTLLIFALEIPSADLMKTQNLITVLHSLTPTIGITLVSFVLIGYFWIYHHQFINLKTLNLPYLWLNLGYLASVSFIPFTTLMIGSYPNIYISEILFGLNILIALILLLSLFHYANYKGFNKVELTKREEKYFKRTFILIIITTIIISILMLLISTRLIYGFLAIPTISMIRDVNYRMEN